MSNRKTVVIVVLASLGQGMALAAFHAWPAGAGAAGGFVGNRVLQTGAPPDARVSIARTSEDRRHSRGPHPAP